MFRARKLLASCSGGLHRHARNRHLWSSALISPKDAKSENAIFVDGTWFMPNHPDGLSGTEAHIQRRIKGSFHFDIDAVSRPSKYPHMLPESRYDFWSRVKSVVSASLATDAPIVVYDYQGIFAAARVWYSLVANGATNVRVLDGGLASWEAAGGAVEAGEEVDTERAITSDGESVIAGTTSLMEAPPSGIWSASRVAAWADRDNQAARSRRPIILDARSTGRFSGVDPEPRPEIVSGHIPGSFNLPFDRVLQASTPEAGTRLLEPAQLREAIRGAAGDALEDTLRKGKAAMAGNPATEKGGAPAGEEAPNDSEPDVVLTCGSGVTASVLALALHEVGVTNVAVYDGSWTEWGTLFGEAETVEVGATAGGGEETVWRRHPVLEPHLVAITRKSWDRATSKDDT